MNRYLVDTNVLLRFLTGEPAEQAKRAKAFFEKSETGEICVRISPLVVTEVIFILTGRHYGFARSEVARTLTQFLQNPAFEVEQRDVVLEALEIFRTIKIDFVDAWLAADAKASLAGVASFDHDFKKITDLNWMAI